MSQMSLSDLHPPATVDEFALPDDSQWLAAVEATVFALALLKQRLNAGEQGAELDHRAHTEFCRALEILGDIPTSTDRR